MSVLPSLILAVAPLPDPPLLQRVALESPLLPALGLLAVGVLAALLLARRAQGKVGGLIGLACVLAAAALLVSGSLVTTEREVVLSRTRTFVDAVAAADDRKADELIADSLNVKIAGTTAASLDRDALLGVIRSFDRSLTLSSYSVPTSQASIDGGGFARSQIEVRVTPERTEFPTTSWWLLNWRRSPDGVWRINGLECLLFNGDRPGFWLAGEIARFAR